MTTRACVTKRHLPAVPEKAIMKRVVRDPPKMFTLNFSPDRRRFPVCHLVSLSEHFLGKRRNIVSHSLSSTFAHL